MLITAIVKPGSRKNQILKQEGDIWTITIAAKPENNKANATLEKFLAKKTGKKTRILSGFTSKRKTVLLE